MNFLGIFLASLAGWSLDHGLGFVTIQLGKHLGSNKHTHEKKQQQLRTTVPCYVWIPFKNLNFTLNDIVIRSL